MMAELARLADMAELSLLGGFVTFLRVGAVMALMPAFGERSVPRHVRLGLALAFTLVLVPAVLRVMPQSPIGAAALVRLMAGEVLVGLMLGMVFRLLVLALQMAGQIAANATSLSQVFGGASVEPMPAMAHLVSVAGLALAVMLGLHVMVAQALLMSYSALPPGQIPDAASIAGLGMAQVARAFGLAFSLSLPFVIASLIYNLALGVINRAMPQLMVAFVGAPAITAAGLLLLALAAPILLDIWAGWMRGVMRNPLEVP